MIEMELKNSEFKGWMSVPTFMDISSIRVIEFRYRINGIVYETHSKEMVEAFTKERMWEALQTPNLL